MKHKILLGTDSNIMIFLSRVFDLIILNILFLVCSIPVITIGASFTALYSVTLKMVRNEESYIVSGFFHALKRNFLQSTFLWLPCLAGGIFLYMDFRILHMNSTAELQILFIPLLILLIILICIILYAFPIIAYFNCTFKQVCKNILVLIIKHFVYAFLLLGITGIIISLFSFGSAKLTLFLISFFTLIGFSACALLYSWVFRKIFAQYE